MSTATATAFPPFARLRRFAACLGVAALAALPACGAPADGDDDNADTQADSQNVEQPETNDALAAVKWTTVSSGVTYKSYGGGKNVLVVCGGYQGALTAVQKWTDEIVRVKLGRQEFGQIIAVVGPGLGISISGSAIAAKIAAVGAGAQSIVVIGHSSGEATAAQAITALGSQSNGAALQAKTTAFALDGWADSEPAYYPKLYGTYYVTAQSRYTNSAGKSVTVNSRNYVSDRGIKPVYGGTIVLDTTGSGCIAGDCVHDTLINSDPLNKSHFELANDYTNFNAPSHLETRYLDTLGKCLSQSKLTCPTIGGLLTNSNSDQHASTDSDAGDDTGL